MRSSAETRLGRASAPGRVLPALLSIAVHAGLLAVCLLRLTARLPDPAPVTVELQFAPPDALAMAGRPVSTEAAIPDLAPIAEPADAVSSSPPPIATAPPAPSAAAEPPALAEATEAPAAVDGSAPLASRPPAAHAAAVRPPRRPVIRRAAALPARETAVVAPIQADAAASIASAPARAPAPAAAGVPSPAWNATLAAWLAAHRHYPEDARQEGREGAVGVAFTVARDGRIERVTIERPSGVPSLDRSVYAMLEDKRVPPFPDTMPQGHMDVRVVIRFTIER